MRKRRLMQTSLVAAALLVTAVVCAPGSPAITVVTGLSAQAPVYPGPNDVATVATFDAATGAIVTEWTGPQSQRADVVAAQLASAGHAPSAPGSLGSPGGLSPPI